MQDRFTQDGVIYETLPNGNVRVVGYADQPQQSGQVFTLPQDPSQAASDARAAAAAAREQARFEERNKPTLPTGYRMGPNGQAERIPGLPDPNPQTDGAAGSAAVRKNAIDAFNATRQLDTLIAGMEAQHKNIKGQWTRFPGVGVELATEANKNFDTAADSARGPAITALGFTSGQTNTPAEVQQNIGPYIPSGKDYDSQIEQKIALLKGLRDRARDQAIATLGGVPDANGRVTPVEKLTPEQREEVFGALPGAPGGGSNGGGTSVPGGPTGPRGEQLLRPDQKVSFTGDRNDPLGKRYTPEQEAQIQQAIRSGDLGQTLALHQRFSGNPPTEATIASTKAAINAVRKDPRTQVQIGYGAADTAAQAAADKGRYGDYLPQQIDQRQSGLGAGARGTVSGLTLGAAPYIAAAGQSGFGLWGDFNDRLQHARAVDEADYQNNPWPRVGGEIIGGVPSAFGTEAAAARIGSRIPGIAGSFLRSPRTADAIFGGVNAATASGGDPTTTTLGAGAGTVGGMFGRQLFRTAGTPAARALGADIPAKPGAADSMLFNAIDKAGPANVAAQLAEARGLNLPMTLADTGKDLSSLAGAAVRRSPAAAQYAEGQLLPRARGQIDRFGQAVERDLGPIENIPQRSADLAEQAKTKAGPLYDQAYAQPGAGAIYPQIEPFLQRPSMQEALANATRLAKEEGRDPTSLGFTLNAAGEPELTRVPSWQTLDYVKRGGDDVIEKYRDGTTGKLNLDTQGNATNSTLRDFLKVVDTTNPAYAEARAAYAGPKQEAGYLQRGQNATAMDPNQLGVNIAGLNPERLGQMRLGFQSKLMDTANRVRYSSNPFDATLGTPAAEQRLASMYPDNPGVNRLLRQRDLESGMARTNNDILGNSKTAERSIADEGFMNNPVIQAGADIAANTLTGGVPITTMLKTAAGHGIKDALKLGLGKKAVKRAEELAPQLLNANADQSLAELGRVLASVQGYRGARKAIGRVGGIFGAPLLLPFVPTQ
jgi:hypothetical protein